MAISAIVFLMKVMVTPKSIKGMIPSTAVPSPPSRTFADIVVTVLYSKILELQVCFSTMLLSTLSHIFILLSSCTSNDPLVAQAAVISETNHALRDVVSDMAIVVPAQSQEPIILVRSPVETPPTEYLPYPPPSDYPWQAGESPATETPQPSEQNPPAGWYTGESGNPGSNSGGSVANAARPARSLLVPSLIAHALSWILPHRAMPELPSPNPFKRGHRGVGNLLIKDRLLGASAELQSRGPSENNRCGRAWLLSQSYGVPVGMCMSIFVVISFFLLFALMLGTCTYRWGFND